MPGYATEVVSDHAIAMTLALLRRLPELNADVHHGIWDPTGHRPMGQVYGRTFGVVGMGDIGRAVARKARGLGFEVICWSHSLVPGRRTPEGFEVVSYDELLKRADAVSYTHLDVYKRQARHMDEAFTFVLRTEYLFVGASLARIGRDGLADERSEFRTIIAHIEYALGAFVRRVAQHLSLIHI